MDVNFFVVVVVAKVLSASQFLCMGLYDHQFLAQSQRVFNAFFSQLMKDQVISSNIVLSVVGALSH